MQSLVRALRLERGLTLEDLGRITGLSKSYLSKVERGINLPSVAAALKVAEALSVDVSRLFAEEGKQLTIAIDRLAERSHSTPLHPLATEMLGKSMSPFVLHPGEEFVSHAPNHEGQELIFVHRGTIELRYDGSTLELQAGESAYVDSSRTHRLRSIDGTESEVLVVTTATRT